jgi:GT2 family glycosyltransferase
MTKRGISAQSVDVIIPVYNDPDGIRQTLDSITSLTPNVKRISIFIVDNGSTDDTPDVTQRYVESHDYVNLLIEEEIQSSYAARNTGIRNSDGDIILFLDADVTVSEGFVENALETMESQDIDYLGCRVNIRNPEGGVVGEFNQRSGFPVERYLTCEHYAPTCALLVRREVFKHVGLFDPRLLSGGDREFGERVHDAGYEQGYAEDATVYHPARTSLKSLVKKNFRVGRGFCQKQRYYPDRYGKPGVPPSPSGPGENPDKTDELTTIMAFTLLSIAMLATRGLGYYYEFFFGERRDHIPSPTS